MGSENGYPPRPRPVIPTTLLIVAIIVAVGSASGLIWVLFNKTEGPGPVLRSFAERLRDEDCPGSYALLDVSVRRRFSQDSWCEIVVPLRDRLDPGFEVREMLLKEGVAELSIRGRLSTLTEVWRLRKIDATWRVLGPARGFPVPTTS
ncbi:MAG TPA: hypothetical protein VE754_05720 [Actinomycetota bacterium]|nr:hypothetical protein [Actinomycetota bacterium]